jgi:hypothetical protein
LGEVSAVTPTEYKSKYQNKLAFSTLIYNQLEDIRKYGNISSTDKEGLRRFEHSVKMLEALLINFMTETHKELISKTVEKAQNSIKRGDRNMYFEAVLERLMYLMQIVNKVQDLVPEEKAMEVIGEEKDIGKEEDYESEGENE